MPAAANLNMVPTALLGGPDRNGVIRVQAPTVILLLRNVVLMCFLAFPR